MFTMTTLAPDIDIDRVSALIRETAEGPPTPRVPACYLREHPNATLLVDAAAGGKLTAVATPWLLGKVDWTDELIKRAVLWLSEVGWAATKAATAITSSASARARRVITPSLGLTAR